MLGKRLEKSDTIGLISPSSGAEPSIITSGIKFIQKLGFKVICGNNILKCNGYLAGKDTERSSDLNKMFLDTNVDMILCIRGGYGAARTLPFIDFDVVKNNPKIFVGFSDITVFLNAFYQKCGLVTFHGPMLNSKLNEKSLSSLLNTLMYGFNPYIISNTDCILTKSNCSLSIDGTLVGGNLSVFCSLLSTPYEVDTNNKILLLEDIDEDPYKIDRYFTQLIQANKLQNCKAILLGQFTNCTSNNNNNNNNNSFSVEEVIKERLYPLNIPVVYNFMSGHGTPNLTLPIGSEVRLNCNTGEIIVSKAVVK